MPLVTTQVEDFDRFIGVFSTNGAESASSTAQGSAHLPRPLPEDRVWAVFDWDLDGWQNFVSDPDVPPIIREAGHKGKPQVAEFASECHA